MLKKHRKDPNASRENISPATRRGSRIALKHFWQWCEDMEYWTPGEVSGRIQEYIYHMQREGKSPRTVRLYLSYASQFLRANGFAIDRRSYDLPRLPPDKDRTLSEEQVRRLLFKARGWPFAPCIYLALFCGLRVSETQRLRWEDVCLDRGPNGEARGWVRVVGGKSKRDRTIPLCDEVQTFLERWQATDANGPYVYHYHGKQTTAYPGRLSFLGVTDGWHSLRHTFATRYADTAPAGEPALVTKRKLQRLMGHENGNTTDRYLSHKADNEDMEGRMSW